MRLFQKTAGFMLVAVRTWNLTRTSRCRKIKHDGNFVSFRPEEDMLDAVASYISVAAFEQKGAICLHSGVSLNVTFFQINSCCFTAFIA
ncbi:hypothetical protein L798_15357 [Zootermopsis nevadensis]|uniref:Uncharacterized protein n=1 Tax=Zootermopsis nevadensis TaxID=136037 RepID=A0A067QQP5_ZOONE|nr:hypothetical protein L798_15357 [Zootermopsis nevadensis]